MFYWEGEKITCVKSLSCLVGCSFASLYWDFPLFYPVMVLLKLKISWKNAFFCNHLEVSVTTAIATIVVKRKKRTQKKKHLSEFLYN